MLRRLISLLLSVVMVVSLVPPGVLAANQNGSLQEVSITTTDTGSTEPNNPVVFEDVKPSDWFYEAALYVGKNGLFQGTGGNKFSPQGTMTRAMFVTVLGRMAGIEPSDYAAPDFADVPAHVWYTPYVQWAVEHNITSGTGARMFSPNATLPREQMVTLTVRFFEAFDIPLATDRAITSEPKDIANAAPWAVSAIKKLWQAGLVSGDGHGNFNPKSNASRAEAASFLMRSHQVVTSHEQELEQELEQEEPTTPTPSPTPGPAFPPVSGPTTPAIYNVQFESNGGTEFDSYTVSASAELGILPPAYLADHIFVGWYTNRELTQPAYEDMQVEADTTLYARYETIADPHAPPSSSRVQSELDQPTTYTVDVYSDPAHGLTASDVKAGLLFESLFGSDFASTTGVKVTAGSNGHFTVAANNTASTFVEGETYRITLKNDQLSFADYEDSVREFVFSIERQEVHNLTMNPKLVNIPANEVTEMKVNVNGSLTEVSPNSLSLMKANVSNEGGGQAVISDNQGTFKYSGTAISVGDTIAIYDGLKPEERDLNTPQDARTPISYVEIVDIDGNTYSYKMASLDNVLFIPDRLPLDKRLDTDGNMNDNVMTVPADAFDYSVIYNELGVKAGFEVETGDFLVLHAQNTATAVMEHYERIVRITDLQFTDGFYTIAFVNSSVDEALSAVSYYEKPELHLEDLGTNKQARMVEQQIAAQVTESGFSEKAAQFLVATLLESEQFAELEQQYDMPVKELRQVTIASSDTEGKVKLELDTPDVSIKNELNFFKDKDGFKGATVSVKLGATITIKAGDNHNFIIKLTAEFQQEIALAVSLSIDEVFEKKVFFVTFTDTVAAATADFSSYTAVEFKAQAGLFEKGEEPEWDEDKEEENILTQQIQAILDGKTAEESGIQDSFAEMYSDMLKNDTDWVPLVRQLLAKIPIGSPQSGLVAEINLTFVVSALVNVSIGAVFNNEINKRVVLSVNIDQGQVTNDLITTKDQFTFTLYVMGTLGLRAGIEGKFEVGLISLLAASVGLQVEVGAYIQFWGYFYYQLMISEVYNVKNPAKPIHKSESTFRGDYLLEIGVYVKFALIAQAVFELFTVSKDLYDEQFPIAHIGNKSSLIGFPEREEEDMLISMGDKKVINLPSDLFDMEVMPLKEGGISKETKNPSQFTYAFSNAKFSFDPQKKKLTYSGNEAFDETTMTLTWKEAEKSLQPEKLSLTVNVTYGVLEDHYTISLYSLEYAGQAPALIRTIEVAYNDSVLKQANPTRSGYQFDKWYADDKGTVVASLPDKMPARSLNYYAKWNRDPAVPYSIRIYFLNPNTNKFDILHETLNATAPEGTTIHNSREYAHYYSVSGSPFIVRSDANNTRDFLYTPESHTVTYNTGIPGVASEQRQHLYGSMAKPYMIPVDGYTFQYWELSHPGGSIQKIYPGDSFKVVGNMVLKGVYTADPVSIDVRYNIRDTYTGASRFVAKLTQKATVGQSFTPDVTLWSDPDGSSKMRYVTNPPESSTIAVVKQQKGQYVNIYYEQVYKYTFDAVGGQGGTTGYLAVGEPIVAPAVTKAGYTFMGWSPALPAMMSAGAQTFTAVWQSEEEPQTQTYRIEYYQEDLVPMDYLDYDAYDDTFSYNKTYSLIEEATEEGTGEIGDAIEAVIKEFTGFTYDEYHLLNVVEGDIAAEDELVLKVYYSRNVYELSFIYLDEPINGDFEAITYKVKYGDFLNMKPDDEWTPRDGSPKVTAENTVTMPARNVAYDWVYPEP